MSLLERIAAGHLSERDFARLSADRTRHPHLDACGVCRERYARFEQWMAQLDADLQTEADAAFPPERLAAQQAQITRRLEALERPARVIAFPKAARAVITNQSHAGRWVAAAAAAGVIAGIALGQVVNIRETFEPTRMARSTAAVETARSAPMRDGVVPVSTLSAGFTDEDFLIDTDALAHPRVSELRAIDDLTPHARDLMRPR